MRRSAGAAIAAALALLGMAPAASAQDPVAPPSPDTLVAQSYKQLKRDARGLPRQAIKKKHKAKLLRGIKKSRKQARKGKACKAARTLRRKARRGIRRVHEKQKLRSDRPTDATRRGVLWADVIQAQVSLMQLPSARRCGGGRRATVTETSSEILESTERRLRMKVNLPAPTFASHRVRGTTYEQMFMEGMGETGDTGKPGIPQQTKFFGVPEGANVQVTVNGVEGNEVKGADLYPAQESAVDIRLPQGAPNEDVFHDKPFALDTQTYASNAPFPAQAAEGAALGTMRNLRIGGVDVAGGQYQPRSKALTVFTSIDVTVEFAGENRGVFGSPGDFGNKWETFFNRNYERVIVNDRAVFDHLSPAERPFPFCGEELLVITSPALQPAALAFRAAKSAQGFLTSVVTTDVTGGTKEQIQSFIRSRLSSDCFVRPTFVVLFGNTAAVPTWLVPCSPGGDTAECNIASDLPYSLDGIGSDLFADVMLGRIPAQNNEQALQIVNKIITYQNVSPAPEGDDFFRHATVTGYFQPAHICVLDEGESGTPDCDPESEGFNAHWEIDFSNRRDTRGFTKTTDRILKAMNQQSYTVDRLWTTHDGVFPEKYYDNTNIPDALRRPAFPWDSDTTDFLDAYQQGRFLIMHRDHGWPDGWAEPTLHSGHVPELTNGAKLPVVFGINCSSAAFDDPSHPSFVELQIMKPDGGAVAGFGDTRVSPSFPNNHMARGFMDALFPKLEPEFGSDVETRRLGDVLLSGKAFMASMEGVDWQGAGDTYVEHYLYHLLGDPTMQMWARPPFELDLRGILSRYVAGQVHVKIPINPGDPPPENTVLTLLNNGQAIGRALVGASGEAVISPEVQVEPENLQVSIVQDGALPAQDAVEDVPPKPQPQPEKVATTLSLDQPPAEVASDTPQAFTGRIDPAFAGANVRLVFTQVDNQCGRQDGATFTREATTDANGDYKAEVTFSPNQCGAWTVRAHFDGDDGHLASSSPERRFETTD